MAGRVRVRMRGWCFLALTVLSSAASAQDDPRDLFDQHSASNGGNGATRVGRRMGDKAASAPTAPGPLVQPANSMIHVYKPRPLNDLARDIAKGPH